MVVVVVAAVTAATQKRKIYYVKIRPCKLFSRSARARIPPQTQRRPFASIFMRKKQKRTHAISCGEAATARQHTNTHTHSVIDASFSRACTLPAPPKTRDDDDYDNTRRDCAATSVENSAHLACFARFAAHIAVGVWSFAGERAIRFAVHTGHHHHLSYQSSWCASSPGRAARRD